MRQFNFILILIFTFNGCGLIKDNTDSFKFKYLHSTSVTDFDNLTENLLNQLCSTIQEPRISSKPIYVVDFVNLQELENHSELGFLLSDELKTHVTQKCNIPVYALEYAKYLKIGANGTKLLSRNINELSNTKIKQTAYALVGTYAFTQRQLILYLKLIDLKNGIILKSATHKTTLTDEIINLEKKPKSYQKNIYQPVVL